MTDTQGNLLAAMTHPADMQDRDGAPGVIAFATESWPDLSRLFAASRRMHAFACRPTDVRTALQSFKGLEIEVVKRPDALAGFVVIACRWVVERTFAWLGRCRRLAKHWEASIASSDARLLSCGRECVTTIAAGLSPFVRTLTVNRIFTAIERREAGHSASCF